MSSLEGNETADVDANQDQEWECPSIPILSTRWGLGEGVDPATVFKPIPIPPHLMKEQPLGPPDPRRALRGRGRSAGLSVHSEIIDPGDLEPLHPDPAPVSLSISEQISRVPQANLVIHQKADYGQYLLPARDDGSFGPPRTSPTKRKNRRSPAAAAPVTMQRPSNWSGVLDPKAGVTAVDSALARAMPLPERGGAGAGDAPPVAGAGRTYASSDDEDDCYLEACSDSSASSSGRPFSLRRWRPRPPPIASTEAFPPLPGSHSAVVAATAAAARPSAASRRPDKPVYTPPAGRGSPRPQTAPEPVSDVPATQPSSSEPAAAGGGGDGQSLRPGQVKVTGVTDENWGSVQELIGEYGAITHCERHGDTGYLTLSPASNADWVREVMGEGAPGDCGLPGVAFPLADDQEVD